MFCHKYLEQKSPLKMKSWTRSKARSARVSGERMGRWGMGWHWKDLGGCGEAPKPWPSASGETGGLDTPIPQPPMEVTVPGKCGRGGGLDPWSVLRQVTPLL